MLIEHLLFSLPSLKQYFHGYNMYLDEDLFRSQLALVHASPSDRPYFNLWTIALPFLLPGEF